MKLSKFGRSLSSGAGIVQLMDDLGSAMSTNRDMLMLGGGNPGQIPEMQARFRERMQRILEDDAEFERLVGNYDPPGGNPRFIQALARMLGHEYNWGITPENIALTNGSQSASFMLLNMFAGARDDQSGAFSHILLPLIPEYIGYADQGLGPDFFRAARPEIEHLADRLFKYHVDFNSLEITPDTGAICVSRPTNPTGNVLTDDEIQHLISLAREHDIPLIIDNAYGTPFPNIIFTDATPIWNEHVIVCMSLSKLGLPGVRTGVVIASREIIKALAGINAILNLSTGGFGASLVLGMVENGEVTRLSRETVRPFYEAKARRAVDLLRREFQGYDVHIHKPEGAIFLWLWFRNLPVTCEELYQRLKRRGVLVIPGHHFFPGLNDAWRHRHECIRVTYSQSDHVVEKGLRIIADEARRAYAEA